LYLAQTIINRSASEYSETDDQYDKQIVQFLVEAILLGLPAQFPTKRGLAGEMDAIQAWSVAGKSSL
jgi:hypothetical protein